MGDRTFYRLTLPEGLTTDQLRCAASAFTEDEWTTEEAERLQDGACSVVVVDIEERLCGDCRKAADAVQEALGGQVAFTVTEDPKYEWLGTICRYDPERGMHETECGPDGQAVLTASSFEATSQAAQDDPAAVVEQLRRLLGIDWVSP